MKASPSLQPTKSNVPKHTIEVLCFDTKPYDREYFENAKGRRKINITYIGGHLTSETATLTRNFDAICIFVNDNIDADIARTLAANGIQLIALRCAGYNNIDFRSLPPQIKVVRVPAYSPHAVAEYTIALILSANRKTHRAYYRTRDNNFTLNGLAGFDMYKRTAGVIGTGQIGRLAAQLLRGFQMRVLAYDIMPNNEWAAQYGIEMVDLTTLYRESDIITLHCPLTPENMYMINKGTIGMMKDNVMIINTGRGKLINTADLLEALKQRKVGSAALDVYEEEGNYFFEDYSTNIMQDDLLARLLTYPNVLVTSHQAFFTHEALTNIANTTLHNIHRFFRDGIIENEVTVLRA